MADLSTQFNTKHPPRPGDILLFHRATGLNRIITWFTGSPYYHVAICESEFLVVEARPKGVVRRDLRSHEGGRHYRVAPAPEGKGEAALRWALGKLGAGYDRLDIAIIVLERMFRHLHINYTPRSKFSCGEFVAMAFQQVGAPLFPDHTPAEVTPADFAALLPASQHKVH